jgi:hypothetical protein
VKGDVLELASFKKIDPKEAIDEETQKAYSRFLNKLVDKIKANDLPKMVLEYCKEIYTAYFKLSNDQQAATDKMVNFLILRIYSPMVVVDFPKVLAQLEQQAIANKQDTTELKNQKEAFKVHGTLVSKLLQNSANKTIPNDRNLHVFIPLIESITQRFVQLADQILIRIQSEELQELPDDEELQEIEDDEPLFEIVEHDGKEFVIGAITNSNPKLWEDHVDFTQRFCISTDKPTIQGAWDDGNRFCSLMALQWLDKRPQTLKFGELSQDAQIEMANKLVGLDMNAQVSLAKSQLGASSSTTLAETVYSRTGALIWMGTDKHVMAAEILGNGTAKFYDPDIGTTVTIAISELKQRASECNIFVVSA